MILIFSILCPIPSPHRTPPPKKKQKKNFSMY